MISADAIRGYIDLIVLSLLKRQPSYLSCTVFSALLGCSGR